VLQKTLSKISRAIVLLKHHYSNNYIKFLFENKNGPINGAYSFRLRRSSPTRQCVGPSPRPWAATPAHEPHRLRQRMVHGRRRAARAVDGVSLLRPSAWKAQTNGIGKRYYFKTVQILIIRRNATKRQRGAPTINRC
jgi:hypothetical protein